MANISDIQRLAKQLNLQNLSHNDFNLQETKLSNLDFIEMVLKKELYLRKKKKITKLKKKSRLPKSSFDVTRVPEVINWHITELLKFEWVKDNGNLFIIGECNTGKSSIASYIGNSAVITGNKVFYIKIDDYLETVKNKMTENKAKSVFNIMKESDIIIIDDVMYIPFTNEQLQLFYRTITFLNESRSIVIITNREISDWIETAEDKHLIQTLIDRLMANSNILRLKTDYSPEDDEIIKKKYYKTKTK